MSSFYTQQLNALMTTLHATEPHFIRQVDEVDDDDDDHDIQEDDNIIISNMITMIQL